MGAHIREQVSKKWYAPRVVEVGNKVFGKFRTGKKDNYEYFDVLDGALREIVLEIGEFDGEPTRSYNFILVDEDGSQSILQSSEQSAFAQSMLSKLASLELIDTVSISAYVYQINDKNIVLPSIRVGGEKIKPYYRSIRRDDDPDDALYLPETHEIMVNNKKVTDKTERLRFLEDLHHALNARMVNNPANWRIDDQEPVHEKPKEKPTEEFDDVPF